MMNATKILKNSRSIVTASYERPFKKAKFSKSKQTESTASSSDNTPSIQLGRQHLDRNEVLKDCRFVIFDFETTGLSCNSDQILELGAVVYKNGKVEERFQKLVKPTVSIPPFITKLTGINNRMVQNEQELEDVLPDFLEFMKAGIPVAHNATFDLSFLRAACRKTGVEGDLESLCTKKLANKYLSDLPKKDLGSLAKHFGLTFESRHRSIGDCLVTADVLNKILEDKSNKLETVGDLDKYCYSC